jgi:hypothetical protein
LTFPPKTATPCLIVFRAASTGWAVNYYSWKAKYAGFTVSELKRLKAFEDENRRLKQIVAD